MRTLWTLALIACGGGGDGGPDAGPAECPVGAPDDGSDCDERLGACTYEGLNPACPPLVGQCRCREGRWSCEPPECTTCSESCNGECCNLDDVCRSDTGAPGQECGPRGGGTAEIFEGCGHETDCMGLRPICSPICGDLCCTFTCDAPEECPEGVCANGVCTPEE